MRVQQQVLVLLPGRCELVPLPGSGDLLVCTGSGVSMLSSSTTSVSSRVAWGCGSVVTGTFCGVAMACI